MNIYRPSTSIESLRASVTRLFDNIDKRKIRWWSPRGLMLFILPCPLIPTLFITLAKGDLQKSIVVIASIGLYFAAALLARRGLIMESLLNDGVIVKRSLPLKNIAAILASIATGICSWQLVDNSALFSILLGLLTSLAFYFSYGLNSRQSQPDVVFTSGLDPDSLLDTLHSAKQKISRIENVSQAIVNPELKSRLLRITRLANDIVARIEQDPKDWHRARKFLFVYLDGAQKVTEGYGKTHKQANSIELEDKFRNVLVTIEDVFSRQKQHMLENDILDLDVHIEVLNKQMQQEGFR